MKNFFIPILVTATILLSTIIYFIFSDTSRSLIDFSNFRQVSFNLENGEKNVNNEIVFESNINGQKFYSENEPSFFKNRPLGVMINNAVPARPQIGLNQADLIYEIVAEGGITRFLAFYQSELPNTVGPIRSIREYYLLIVKELADSMVMHIGYSPMALDKIDKWSIKSLQFAGAEFFRNNFGNSNLATEHTAFADANKLFETGSKLGWGNISNFEKWKFKDDISTPNGEISYIEINFWYRGDYTGVFKYDSSSNLYRRYSGLDENGNPILLRDRITKEELKVKNVIVQFADEIPIPNDDKGRLDYNLVGEGKALIFLDGKVIDGFWKKDKLESRTKFYNTQNKEIEFNRGKIWISVVPSRNINQVVYR